MSPEGADPEAMSTFESDLGQFSSDLVLSFSFVYQAF